MTTIVAIGLALASSGLKEAQNKNIELDIKKDILKCVGLHNSDDIQTAYDKHIQGIVINAKGEVIEEDETGNPVDASQINAKAESKKPAEQRRLPLYKFTSDEGETAYIIPLRGSGLWDEIWGFIAIKDDFKTVYGASFDHKAETPGLGAEINEPLFQSQFPGKAIYDEQGNYTSVEVVKGAKTRPEHQVDGISGGTITSDGVHDMLYSDIKKYLPYFEKLKKN